MKIETAADYYCFLVIIFVEKTPPTAWLFRGFFISSVTSQFCGDSRPKIHLKMSSYPPIEEDHPRRGVLSSPTLGSSIEPPRSLKPQCFAALTATVGGLIMGTCIGWSGPVIHILSSNSSSTEFPVSTTQCNFIASLMPAGALFGGTYFK